MKLEDLASKSVCILGFGKEGQSTLKALSGIVPADQVTIADTNPDLLVDGYTVNAGADYLRNLSEFDVIIKSPGIPPLPEIQVAREAGKVTSSLQLFLDTVQSKGATVIGVTGSKGKSTTSALIHSALVLAGKPTFLVGNIGTPVFDALSEARSGTIFVTEMSSYQLLDITSGPDIAVVTSFFPEHLDYHGSTQAYLAAKMRIAETQQQGQVIFFDADQPECAAIAEKSPGNHIACTEADSPVELTEIHLLGTHNLHNCALAWRVLKHLGIPEAVAQEAFRNFKGLPHRLEIVGTYHDIIWVDDAISTTPESTSAALQALGESVETLVVGGLDRGYTFSELGKRIAQSQIKTLILLAGSGEAIWKAVQAALPGTSIQACTANDMEEVVALAREHTTKGSICLLSTASPSYNSFKNFEEKGKLFQEAVKGN